MNKWLFFLYFTTVFCSSLFAQNSTTDSTNNLDVLYYLPSLYEEESDLLIEQLQGYQDQPIPINSISFYEIQNLPFLNFKQAYHLNYYITRYGAIRSVYEMQNIPGFSLEFCLWIAQFIDFSSDKLSKYLKTSSYNRLGGLVQKKKGYKTNTNNVGYLGNRWRVLTRNTVAIKQNNSQLKIGLIYEKDPGEQYLYKTNPQHLSSFAELNVEGKFPTQIVLGDFKTSFGKGLLYNDGFQSSVLFLLSGINSSSGIRENNSSDEYRFGRGIAISTNYKKFKIEATTSIKKTSGVISEDQFNIYETGYFRTNTELVKRNKILSQRQTYAIYYQANNWVLGLTKIQDKLEDALITNPNNFKNQNGYSSYFKYQNSFIYSDFELSKDNTQNLAFQQSNQLYFKDQELISLLNIYAVNYDAPYSNSITSMGDINNENSYTVIYKFNLLNWNVSLLNQHAIFPNPTLNYFGNSFKSQKIVELKKFHNNFQYYIRYKYSNQDKLENIDFWKKTVLNNNHQIRLNLIFIKEQFTYQNRLETVVNKNSLNEKSIGWLNYHDFAFERNKSIFRFRLAFFDIQNHDSRIYVYQPTVSYAFGMDFYNQPGASISVRYQYSLSNFKLQFYIHHQHYFDVQNQSTGKDEINGPAQTQFQIQLIYNLYQKLNR